MALAATHKSDSAVVHDLFGKPCTTAQRQYDYAWLQCALSNHKEKVARHVVEPGHWVDTRCLCIHDELHVFIVIGFKICVGVSAHIDPARAQRKHKKNITSEHLDQHEQSTHKLSSAMESCVTNSLVMHF